MLLHAIRCRFGRLDGEYVFSPDRLNLVLEDNERGKTTLVEAILAGLYGYKPGGEGILERQRYLPVDSGPCFIELEMTARGRRLLLHRELSGAATDTVRVTDLGTAQDVTAELAPTKGHSTPGELLLRLTREQFLKICLVRQGQIGEVRDGATLTERIQAVVDTSDGVRTSEAAIVALDDAVRNFEGIAVKKGLIGTEIKRLSDKAEDARRDQKKLRAGRDEIDAEARRLEQLDAEGAADLQREDRLAGLADRATIIQLKNEQREWEERAARAEALQRKIAGLEAYRQASPDGAARIEAGWNDVVKARQDVTRLQEEARNATLDVEDKRTRHGRFGPVAAWDARRRDEVVAAQRRLTDAKRAHEEAETGWQDALRNAAPEARTLYEGGSSAYEEVSDVDIRMLLAYPADLAQATMAVERLRSTAQLPSPDAPRPRYPLLIAGAIVVAVGLVLLAVQPAAAAATVVAGGLLLASGWILRSAPRVDEAAVEARALTRRDLEEAEKRLAELKQQGTAFAARVGAVTAAEAAEGAQRFLSAHKDAAGLRTQAELRRRADIELESAGRELSELWASAGRESSTGQADAAEADRLLRLVDDAMALRGQLTHAELTQERTTQALHAAKMALDQAALAWDSLCAGLGVPASDAKSAADMARDRAERRRELEGCELELQLLNADMAGEVSDESQVRLDELNARVATAIGRDPSLADLAVDRSAGAYLDERETVRQRREARLQERQELRDSVGRVLDDFRRQMPAALGAEQEAEERSARVRRYGEALALAMRTLREVARESHQAWAETLNTYAGTNLRHLAPNYPEVHFGEQLEVSVLDAARRPWSPGDGRLSAGTRDRIYLAVRLALADYCLPEGDALPLILDDPFATSDDDRCEEAMRFLLIDVSHRHQVVVLTCHRQRHEALERAGPELWSSRVHKVSLSGTAPTPPQPAAADL